jgi:predicted DNA-binding transcriptional regulator AlpA
VGKVVALPGPGPVTLADLAREPGRAADVPAEAIPGLLAQLAAAQTALAGRLLAMPSGTARAPSEELLTVEEAARRLATTPDWLYRRARRLPFAVRVGPRQLRFSSAGIDRYIRLHQGS